MPQDPKEALRKASGISAPTLQQRLADMMTEGITGGEPGPVDLAIALPGLGRKLTKVGIEEALARLKQVPDIQLGPSYFQNLPPSHLVPLADYDKANRPLLRNIDEIMYDGRGPKPSRVKMEDPNDLTSVQSTVERRGVENYVQYPPFEGNNHLGVDKYYPEVVELPDGRKFVMDGHHRSTSAYLKGEELPTNNYNLEELIDVFLQREPRKNHARRLVDSIRDMMRSK